MEVAILAVTKRYNGVCIAAVDKNLKWFRPTKITGLTLEDIRLKNHSYISTSKVYDIPVGKKITDGCQTENYLIDEKEPITFIKDLSDSQREKLFLDLSENEIVTSNPGLDISNLLKKRNRSLILLGPIKLESVSISSNGRMESRVMCRVSSIRIKGQNEVYNLPCTDLKIRAFSKRMLKERKSTSLTLKEEELKKLLKFDQAFIAIGLTGEHRGDNWPMIIGIHTIPDYKQEIDYDAI